ncbi:MAG: arylsulfatase [Pirellulaceae bacterium]|nr:MAG: arylsulfatase [Pirellulaceae bacterium]
MRYSPAAWGGFRQHSCRALQFIAFLIQFVGLVALPGRLVGAQEEPPRPNFVIVLCDDLGYGDLQCYGHPHIKTPNLNRMAGEGLRLTNFYSAAPVCSPSRVGLLTGRSPNLAGVYDWIPPATRPQDDLRDLVHLRREEITLPQLLSDAGYATCLVGKWHCNSKFNSNAQPQPNDAGFDYWFATQNNAAPSHENPNNFVRNGEPVGPIEGYSCQIVVDEAIRWLEQQRTVGSDQPFFLYVAFHEPHEPVASPPELVAQYLDVARNEDEAQYFANVANVDVAVGRLFDALKRLDVDSNTVVVFTSDNGPETLRRYARARRSYGRPGPLRGMKLWTTDGGFRVAGILRWPAGLQRRGESDEVVSALDLLPTFCRLAGADIPATRELDGIDLSPLLRGQSIERPRPLLWCYYNALNEHQVAMRHGPWKMLAKLDHGQLPRFQNVHRGNVQRVHAARLTDFELYHVTDDIDESDNLIDQVEESPRLRELMEREYRRLVDASLVWSR